MNRRLLWLWLGLLPAAPSFAQQIPVADTARAIPTAPPVVVPVGPQPTPASMLVAAEAAPPRIDVTDPRPTLQAPVYVPLDQDVYRLIDRYAIMQGADSLGDVHTSTRPYNRAAVARLAERAGRDSAALPKGISRADRFNLRYLLRDNWPYVTDPALLADNVSRRPLLSRFYRTPTDLYSVQIPDFTLRVSPIINFQVGRDTDQEGKGVRFLNSRGVQVEGIIDKRLGFFSSIMETQTAVPLYVQQRVERDNAVPHEGFWKYFKNQPDQFDFITARGYLTYAATRHINVQLGHDRNFVGNGYRSLILSDFSAPYLFLKLNTRVWKLNYQNMFAEMTAERARRGGTNYDTIFEKKYFAMHHLSVDITPSLNVGVFESVMFGRRRGRFELQYLNPIIFYRAVEQAVGSNDNAILGADFKWNIRRRGQIYGQVVLDEFLLNRIREGTGWWANKQALQLGGKYLDVAGIRNLDLQAEFNFVRPFMYQHVDQYRNYQHYGQPLAHPMGASLSEVFGQLAYQPLPRLTLVGKAFYTVQGLDVPDPLSTPPTTINYGGNVLKSYNTRPMEFGYSVGSGLRHELLHADFTATWQARLNLWLDAKLIVRDSNLFGRTAIPSLSLRWNAAQRLYEF